MRNDVRRLTDHIQMTKIRVVDDPFGVIDTEGGRAETGHDIVATARRYAIKKPVGTRINGEYLVLETRSNVQHIQRRVVSDALGVWSAKGTCGELGAYVICGAKVAVRSWVNFMDLTSGHIL